MKRVCAIVVVGTAVLASAACSSVPRNTGTSYECNGGTRLKVDHVGNGAIVRVNGRQTLALKSAPANYGQIYENRTGARLQRHENGVTWNTALRSAPESCRVVNTPL